MKKKISMSIFSMKNFLLNTSNDKKDDIAYHPLFIINPHTHTYMMCKDLYLFFS